MIDSENPSIYDKYTPWKHNIQLIHKIMKKFESSLSTNDSNISDLVNVDILSHRPRLPCGLNAENWTVRYERDSIADNALMVDDTKWQSLKATVLKFLPH